MDHIVFSKYFTPFGRGWEWMAHLAGDASEGFYGFGHTEIDAYNDLLKNMAEA